jgi:hypothetical protein
MIVVPIFGFLSSRSQTARPTRAQQHRNRPPKIQTFTSAKSLVEYCLMNSTGGCSSEPPTTMLQVKATDSDNDELTYKYSVSGGRINEDGARASWDLYKAFVGSQIATVEVSDGHGGKASSRLRINVKVCGACDLPCPTVYVSCPQYVTRGEMAIFTAIASGGNPDWKIRYVWKQTNGKVIGGTRSSKLRVKAGSAGEELIGIVKILGLDPSCSYEASCTSKIQGKAPSTNWVPQ